MCTSADAVIQGTLYGSNSFASWHNPSFPSWIDNLLTDEIQNNSPERLLLNFLHIRKMLWNLHIVYQVIYWNMRCWLHAIDPSEDKQVFQYHNVTFRFAFQSFMGSILGPGNVFYFLIYSKSLTALFLISESFTLVLRFNENMVLRKMFGPKMDMVTPNGRRLHEQDL